MTGPALVQAATMLRTKQDGSGHPARRQARRKTARRAEGANL